MPTGYTAPILEGATFEEFVWGTARAFGAFIMQRDDANGAPPVMEEKPDDYYPQALDKAISELSRLEALTDAEWKAEHKAACDRLAKERDEQNARNEQKREKYMAMLDRVKGWTPPTPEHIELKKFMVDQINDSIRFDCFSVESDDPFYRVAGDWRKFKSAQLARAAEQVEYYRTEKQKEIDRIAARNKWKAELVASVPLPATKRKGK